ncbi:hypothetical protein CGL51_06145 [Pyrobaculum aerophilum]|uniref:Uncharacterized protein n=1 Tax=Pyrobaculum aerophilum TaxID=13773 RepID=A0A371QZA0_9CREN|nr:hypothetical protein CGL51_06145 [Pyrobaculum aerophilum]
MMGFSVFIAFFKIRPYLLPFVTYIVSLHIVYFITASGLGLQNVSRPSAYLALTSIFTLIYLFYFFYEPAVGPPLEAPYLALALLGFNIFLLYTIFQQLDVNTGKVTLLKSGLWALSRRFIVLRVLKFAGLTGAAAAAMWLVLGQSPHPFVNALYAALVYTLYGLRYVDVPLIVYTLPHISLILAATASGLGDLAVSIATSTPYVANAICLFCRRAEPRTDVKQNGDTDGKLRRMLSASNE